MRFLMLLDYFQVLAIKQISSTIINASMTDSITVFDTSSHPKVITVYYQGFNI